ncbi:soluble lytic murein transglycosylase-like protein [Nocardioides massiliensis]|uniref:Soluble lytic murein transglycosylase-like protein n=2 Tax=Nocardioides massiliensis TaxID=1325935 RepID=A0ABT9NMQ4_9ACTN|nr:lytic transglycosylase domain-containing protein [Nocardioides massiliensis]MDP9821120.1 soluble lytic murein transglycosylase-like protein [Nocardioides massiliensis]
MGRSRPVVGLFSTLALALALGGCTTGDQPDAASSHAPPATSPSSAPSTAVADPPAPAVLRKALDAPPAPPRTPQGAATALAVAERTIDDPRTPPELLAAAGRVQQVVYRAVAQRPRWDAAVLRALPRVHRSSARKNLASRREFLSMQRGYRPNKRLPAWQVAEPLSARELRRLYRRAERRFGVEWEYLAAINLVETGMGRIRGTSVAGARGPMQFIPETWRHYGRGDIDEPRDAIAAAARYLRARGFTRPGGRSRALYSYNNDVRYVRAVTHLAQVMQERPRTYFGFHAWEIFYSTAAGDVHLPVGYAEREPVPVRRWLARRGS